jgi:hypothetical protein
MNVGRLSLFSVTLAAVAGASFLLGRYARVDSAAPASAKPVAARERPAPEDPPTPRTMTASQWEVALGGEPETAAEAAPAAPAMGTISMPIAEKLVPDRLTEVPHELIGAWDDAPGSSRPGAHRTIVAVVDGSMPSRELEQLVWDIRDYHRGAEVLDVRVYDSAEAATRSSARDGGGDRKSHLVADVKRNDRLGVDQITLYGRVVGP